MTADNSIAANLRLWDQAHEWTRGGDEWTGHARACGKPYEEWKQSLVNHLLDPYAQEANVLEIGPGHGRWTSSILAVCHEAWLVDLSPTCIEFCKQRFSEYDNVHYYVTDGTTLPPDATRRIDFVWSFASFVHMSVPVIEVYLREIERVLVPGGRAIIHHAGRRHSTLRLRCLRRFGKAGRGLYRVISMGPRWRGDGWRSDISVPLFARLARDAGLTVESQTTMWSDGFGVPRFGDALTFLRKEEQLAATRD